MPHTDEQYIREQEELDRLDNIRERREMLMDEFNEGGCGRRSKNFRKAGEEMTKSMELARNEISAGTVEQVLLGGDLKALTAEQRVSYYRSVCESLGLNPLTKPFEYITLNGKLTLYARKDTTDQLRSKHGISIQIVNRELVDDVYVVTARAITPGGRADEDIGAVGIGSLKLNDRANAMMKAQTKAKRRVTLSICGLGWLDETEIETIPTAGYVVVDSESGEIKEEIDTRGETAGTAAAARAVAEAKIEQLKAQGLIGKPEEIPLPVLEIWGRMKGVSGCIKELGKLKAELTQAIGPAGELEYYRALEAYGVKHANEFKSGEDARKCAQKLWKVLQTAEALNVTEKDVEA